MKGEGVKPILRKRRTLAWLGALLAVPTLPLRLALAQTPFAPVVLGYTLRFPRDEGAHPGFRTEWWYVTGWLEDARGAPLGFQVTFFRTQPKLRRENPSAFAPREILIAHAALSDPAVGHLRSEQYAARAGFGLAGASQERTEVWIDDWSLRQSGNTYAAVIPGKRVRLDLVFTATQPSLLHGESGYSRKGRDPASASYYYSLPHLKVAGTVNRAGIAERVSGTAWLDHEWSSEYVESGAAGWDWIGINLDDGGALMAFRMRDKSGGQVWAGGTLRRADGSVRIFTPEDIDFTPRRNWRSPRTGTTYPVTWAVRVGGLGIEIEPLLDDQEHDARASTGTIYWEGAVRARRGGADIGRGYLELTGYWRPLKL